MLAPSPASFSAIGRYALQIYAELSRHFEVDFFGENGLQQFSPVRFNLLEHSGRYFPATAFAERAMTYDHVLYHLGNSDFHAVTAINAFLNPGTAVVHDTYLNGLIASSVNAGIVPGELAAQVGTVDEALELKRSSGLAWIVSRQKRTTTFSSFASGAIEEMPLEGAEVTCLPQPVGVPLRRVRDGLPCTVGFPGIVGSSKGLGLAAKVAALPGVTVKVFGFDPWFMSSQIPKHENVRFLANLSDLRFDEELRSTHIVVNYRNAYHGETSRSTLEAMAAGAVVVVRRVGWFDELPDEVVVKVDTEEEVVQAVLRLVQDPDLRATIGTAAREYLAEAHSYSDHARRLASIVRESLGANPPTLAAPALVGNERG